MAGEIYIADKVTLDKVNVNVGSNSDVASDVGSVHAKLKDIKKSFDNVGTTIINEINWILSNGSIGNLELINVRGKGKISKLKITQNSFLTCKCIIDGVEKILKSDDYTGISFNQSLSVILELRQNSNYFSGYYLAICTLL